MRPAILKGALWLPLEQVQVPGDILRRLTIKRQNMGDEDPQIIQAYSHIDDNYLEVPRQFGLKVCEELGITIEDRTSEGYPACFPKIPTLRDYQVEPVQQIEEAAKLHYDFLFRARTGFGKTLCALYLAARRGRTTLILVDQTNLRDQWMDTLIKFFGFAREDIGIIQGETCSHEGKAVTIAMTQTLSRRGGYAEVLKYFGFLIVDEVHTAGAPTFSMLLFDIPATFRLGISATPKRIDGTQALLTGHLGEVRVAADAEHAKSMVYVVRSYGTYSWYANVSSKVGRFINEVSGDGARNLVFMEIMVWLYQTGRDVLLLSDRIEQLRHLLDMAYYMGVPDEDLGLYTGRDPHYRYAKDALPKDDTPGSPAIAQLQLISKTIPKKTLAHVLEKPRIIGATYGMFQKGVDAPRLCGGVDATPRSSAEQVHGRILRGGAKKEPIWVTVVDWNSYRSIHGSIQRIKDYAKSNAEIHEWLEEGGSRPCPLASYIAESQDRIRELKNMEIVSHKDGRHQLRSLSVDDRLKRLQQGNHHHAKVRQQRGLPELTPISASDRTTRTTKTTGNTASAPRGTPTAATTRPRPVRSHMEGSRSPAPKGK